MEHWHEMALNGKAVSDMALGILWEKSYLETEKILEIK